jgi:hypothetical protein
MIEETEFFQDKAGLTTTESIIHTQPIIVSYSQLSRLDGLTCPVNRAALMNDHDEVINPTDFQRISKGEMRNFNIPEDIDVQRDPESPSFGEIHPGATSSRSNSPRIDECAYAIEGHINVCNDGSLMKVSNSCVDLKSHCTGTVVSTTVTNHSVVLCAETQPIDHRLGPELYESPPASPSSSVFIPDTLPPDSGSSAETHVARSKATPSQLLSKIMLADSRDILNQPSSPSYLHAESRLTYENCALDETRSVDDHGALKETRLVDGHSALEDNRSVDEHGALEENRSVDEHSAHDAHEETRSVDEHGALEETRSVDEHGALEEIRSIDERCTLDETRLVDEHGAHEETRSVDEHAADEETRLVNEHGALEVKHHYERRGGSASTENIEKGSESIVPLNDILASFLVKYAQTSQIEEVILRPRTESISPEAQDNEDMANGVSWNNWTDSLPTTQQCRDLASRLESLDGTEGNESVFESIPVPLPRKSMSCSPKGQFSARFLANEGRPNHLNEKPFDSSRGHEVTQTTLLRDSVVDSSHRQVGARATVQTYRSADSSNHNRLKRAALLPPASVLRRSFCETRESESRLDDDADSPASPQLLYRSPAVEVQSCGQTERRNSSASWRGRGSSEEDEVDSPKAHYHPSLVSGNAGDDMIRRERQNDPFVQQRFDFRYFIPFHVLR